MWSRGREGTFRPALVSRAAGTKYHNLVLQTTKMYWLTLVEAKTLKSKCGQSCASSKGPRENLLASSRS